MTPARRSRLTFLPSTSRGVTFSSTLVCSAIVLLLGPRSRLSERAATVNEHRPALTEERRLCSIGRARQRIGGGCPVLACIKTANGKVEMMDLPVPEPAEGEIVIKMSMATVCGTDMHFLDEFVNEMVNGIYPGVLRPEGLPMGHEAVGIVQAVGPGVTRFQPGDRVISSCLVGCGKCHECMTVDHSMCTGSGGRVGRVLFGCQAEYYRVPFAEGNVARVPDGGSDEGAVLATDIL